MKNQRLAGEFPESAGAVASVRGARNLGAISRHLVVLGKSGDRQPIPWRPGVCGEHGFLATAARIERKGFPKDEWTVHWEGLQALL